MQFAGDGGHAVVAEIGGGGDSAMSDFGRALVNSQFAAARDGRIDELDRQPKAGGFDSGDVALRHSNRATADDLASDPATDLHVDQALNIAGQIGPKNKYFLCRDTLER